MTRSVYSKSFVIGTVDSHQGQLGNVDIDCLSVGDREYLKEEEIDN